MVKSSSRRTLVITILALFALLVLANYTENIVSFAIYNQDSGLYKLNETISLTINQEIPSTSHLTININSQDYIKNLTELTNNFNLTELTINLESFNILLPPGEYLLTSAIINNETVLAISTQPIIITDLMANLVNETTTTQPQYSIPESSTSTTLEETTSTTLQINETTTTTLPTANLTTENQTFSISLIDNKNKQRTFSLQSANSFSPGTYNVVIVPYASNVKELVISGLEISQNISLGLNDFSFISENLTYNASSIDLTNLNYTSATAIGNFTLVCNQFDFQSSTCLTYYMETNNLTLQNTLSLAFPSSTTSKQTIKNESETIKHYAKINQPVLWVKTIKKDSNNYEIQLPNYASNITIEKINESNNLKEKLKLKEKPSQYGIQEITQNKTYLIENAAEINIIYQTPAPTSIENNISDYKKQIIISSDIHYEDILSYTHLSTEAQSSSIRLYWLVNGTKQLIQTANYDLNNNSLIDYIEWVTPSLSNQTYELEITILNVQSYPVVGGNWTVLFNTSGQANLTIQAFNGTTFKDNNPFTQEDLEFLEVRCGNQIITQQLTNQHLFIQDYNCSLSSTETSKVLTEGKHTLEFTFGNLTAYAFNEAHPELGPNITLTLSQPTAIAGVLGTTIAFGHINFTNSTNLTNWPFLFLQDNVPIINSSQNFTDLLTNNSLAPSTYNGTLYDGQNLTLWNNTGIYLGQQPTHMAKNFQAIN